MGNDNGHASHYRQLSLKERAAMFSGLTRDPGWRLLQDMFRGEIRTRITDTDAREAFLYEAIRAQVIQEIFCAPLAVMHQAEREWSEKLAPAKRKKGSGVNTENQR